MVILSRSRSKLVALIPSHARHKALACVHASPSFRLLKWVRGMPWKTRESSATVRPHLLTCSFGRERKFLVWSQSTRALPLFFLLFLFLSHYFLFYRQTHGTLFRKYASFALSLLYGSSLDVRFSFIQTPKVRAKSMMAFLRDVDACELARLNFLFQCP